MSGRESYRWSEPFGSPARSEGRQATRTDRGRSDRGGTRVCTVRSGQATLISTDQVVSDTRLRDITRKFPGHRMNPDDPRISMSREKGYVLCPFFFFCFLL